MSKVAIYCRLSDEDRDKRNKTDESESIQNQKSMLVTYAVERGWDLYKIYCDEDYSGVDKKRPEWNELITDAESRKFNIVLCKTQSRFSRDMEMVEKYIHGKFYEWGIRFVSIVDHADTSVDGNKKARQINGLINEWYLEDLSDNIRRTLNHKKQNGEWTGSFAPYGYMRDPNNKNSMVIDEEAAEVVRKIFNMFLSGMGYHLIAKELNRHGILNPTSYKREKGSNYGNRSKSNQTLRATGNIWTDNTIYHLLRREEYIGVLCQNKTENISYKNQKRKINPKDKWTRTLNAHEPIIDIEMWERTQTKLAIRAYPSKGSGEKHIFSGKVFCGVCKNTLSKRDAPKDKYDFKYLKCRTYNNSPETCNNAKSIRFDLLEEIIVTQINEKLTEYYNPEKIVVEADTEQKVFDKLLKEKESLTSQIEKKNGIIKSLYFDKVERIISSEQFVEFNKTVQDSIDNLNKRIAEIDNRIELKAQNAEKSNNRELLLNKYSQISKLTHRIVDDFIEAVFIGKDIDKETPRKIQIIWNI
jgi:DNA invertase Pin-like site-specific DNA recombinase